jgi:hypothetical protein
MVQRLFADVINDAIWFINIHEQNHPWFLAMSNTNKIHNEKFNYIKFWCDLNIIIRIECILLKFYWGMKALIELHFQHEALHWKCTSVNAFIPQWNFKRMHSILKWWRWYCDVTKLNKFVYFIGYFFLFLFFSSLI